MSAVEGEGRGGKGGEERGRDVGRGGTEGARDWRRGRVSVCV